jgi:hypothetical protein
VPREDLRRGAGHDRRRERRAGELDVAGARHVRRLLLCARRRRRDRPDHEPARRDEGGLVEAVVGVAVGRERGREVVANPRVAAEIDRADGDHERVVAGRVRHPHGRAILAEVTRGRHDRDAVEPELLDGPVERVGREVARHGRVEREVRDLDVAEPLDRRLRRLRSLVALDDQVQLLARLRRGEVEEPLRDVGRLRRLRGRGGGDGQGQRERRDREQDERAATLPPERARPLASAAVAAPPEGVRARAGAIGVVVLPYPPSFPSSAPPRGPRSPRNGARGNDQLRLRADRRTSLAGAPPPSG